VKTDSDLQYDDQTNGEKSSPAMDGQPVGSDLEAVQPCGQEILWTGMMIGGHEIESRTSTITIKDAPEKNIVKDVTRIIHIFPRVILFFTGSGPIIAVPIRMMKVAPSCPAYSKSALVPMDNSDQF
jgi:hypothetical protein